MDDADPIAAGTSAVIAVPAVLPAKRSNRTRQPASKKPAPAAKDDVMNETINTATDQAKATFAEATTRMQGATQQGQQLVEEMSAFGKGNLEAMVESSKIAVRGFETIGQDVAAYARKSMEDAAAAAKTLAAAKSPVEFFRVQNELMRQSFDAMVAETSRSTEAMLKLAGEVAQPISNRVALAADKVKVAV